MKIARDITAAALAGLALELFLAVRVFQIQGDLMAPPHPWLEITQMPGAQIAERLFRYSGLIAALSCAVPIQATLLGLIALGFICACAFCVLVSGTWTKIFGSVNRGN